MSMKPAISAVLIAVLLAALLPGLAASSAFAETADAASAQVQTAPLALQELTKTITGYGEVKTDPRAQESVTLPCAGRIARILVAPGERVAKGAPLLELEASPQERLHYAEALSAVQAAQAEATRVQNLLAQQLATRSELAAAEKGLSDAKAALVAQKKRGTDRRLDTLRAPFAAIVSDVAITPGARLDAGAVALQLTRQDRLLVLLGIEPEEAPQVRPGMTVDLAPLFGPATAMTGTVAIVSGMIDPQTGLVAIGVRLSPHEAVRLMPGARMEGHIAITSVRMLAVPRSAILTDDQGPYLFVVKNDRAHRVDVTTGVKAHGLVAVSGPLAAGDRVVVLGNYELEDGMVVREAPQ